MMMVMMMVVLSMMVLCSVVSVRARARVSDSNLLRSSEPPRRATSPPLGAIRRCTVAAFLQWGLGSTSNAGKAFLYQFHRWAGAAIERNARWSALSSDPLILPHSQGPEGNPEENESISQDGDCHGGGKGGFGNEHKPGSQGTPKVKV